MSTEEFPSDITMSGATGNGMGDIRGRPNWSKSDSGAFWEMGCEDLGGLGGGGGIEVLSSEEVEEAEFMDVKLCKFDLQHCYILRTAWFNQQYRKTVRAPTLKRIIFHVAMDKRGSLSTTTFYRCLASSTALSICLHFTIKVV